MFKNIDWMQSLVSYHSGTVDLWGNTQEALSDTPFPHDEPVIESLIFSEWLPLSAHAESELNLC